jgi:hypothetical protein
MPLCPDGVLQLLTSMAQDGAASDTDAEISVGTFPSATSEVLITCFY